MPVRPEGHKETHPLSPLTSSGGWRNRARARLLAASGNACSPSYVTGRSNRIQPAAQFAHALVHLSQGRLARQRSPGQPRFICDGRSAQCRDQASDTFIAPQIVQSIALLRTFRTDLPQDDADLSAIAADLSDLPLALYLTGGFREQFRAEITPVSRWQRALVPAV